MRCRAWRSCLMETVAEGPKLGPGELWTTFTDAHGMRLSSARSRRGLVPRGSAPGHAAPASRSVLGTLVLRIVDRERARMNPDERRVASLRGDRTGGRWNRRLAGAGIHRPSG